MTENIAFEMIVRCENCDRESSRVISVPKVDGAPTDVNELLESSLLGRLSYSCRHCGSLIGRLVQIQKREVMEPCLQRNVVHDAAHQSNNAHLRTIVSP